MNRKTLTTTGFILFIVGFLVFIHFSNDHIECENIIEHTAGENGEKITTERHLCKESFSI